MTLTNLSEIEKNLCPVCEMEILDFEKPHASEAECVQRLKSSYAHTREFYSCRFERLKQFAKERGIWSEFAAIFANGTVSSLDPPTYAQEFNGMKWAKKKAQKEAATLQKQKTVAVEALAQIARFGSSDGCQCFRTAREALNELE